MIKTKLASTLFRPKVKSADVLRRIFPVCFLGVISFALSGCTLISSILTQSQIGDTGTSKGLTYAWVPSGFIPWTKGSASGLVAYKEMAKGEYSCDYLGCAKVKVVSKEGCSSLYIQANLVDSAGNNVGYANDMTSGVSAGQVAIMTLRISERSATGYQINEISCR